jgi:hypothetical protein
MLAKAEITDRLAICGSTLNRWVEHGLVVRHAYSGQSYLYETPGSNPLIKHSSRWSRLSDRAAALRQATESKCSHSDEGDAV